MALKSIQPARRHLADEVHEQLMDAIMNREIGPDNRLVQARIAAELSISPTPREALMRLEQEGVLEVSSRGSFRIYLINDKEFCDLYQARAAIEGQRARILADKPNPETIAEIRKTVKFEENIEGADAKAFFDANRAIHRKFVEMAGNRFLLEMFDMVWGKVMAFPFMLQLRTSILLSLWDITWRS